MPAVQTLSGPAIVLLGLVSTVLWFLIASFTQTLNLTLYAGVYQHLTGIGPATPAYVNPLPVEPAPANPVSPPPEPLIVPPPALEDEPPPTL
jgi:hypothetical protein